MGLLSPTLAQPPWGASTVACGQVITRDTTLAADVACTGPGDGRIIGADASPLIWPAHQVVRTGDPADNVGIHLIRRTGVKVKHGTVSGFGTGLAIQAGSANTGDGMNLHDNVGLLDGSGNYGDGVGIFNSSRNMVANSTVAHNGSFEGVGSSATVCSGGTLPRLDH